MPKISVLMPVYKTPESYLRETIESVLGQTYADFEFLILDDCPEHPVEDIVKSYSDSRIKYQKNEKNIGISASRNKLIDWAQGEYLAVMDHDDISVPERFAEEASFLDKHPDYGVVSALHYNFVSKRPCHSHPEDDHQIKLGMMAGCVVTHPVAMLRKSVLTDNNIFYEEEFSPAEDYALFSRLIPFTKFHNIQKILLNYRDHSDNTSHKHDDKILRASDMIYAFLRKEHPYLYEEFLLRRQQKTEYKLFGILPVIKSVEKGNKRKILLFGCIPLVTIRQKSFL